MATPPFAINQAVPEDDDIVSQFPSIERDYRDIVESWLLINHNVNGRHDEVEIDHAADGSYAGTASVTTIWASNTSNGGGILKHRQGTGNIEYVGVPPGTMVMWLSDTLPEGWLWANDADVSRSTYARLFGVLSTTFGAGDGSTTFGLPDMRGRAPFGQDDMGGAAAASRVTTAGSNVDGATLGAAGGFETHTLTTAQMPSHNHTLTDPGHTHTINRDLDALQNFGTNLAAQATGAGTETTASNTTGITLANTGGGTAHNNMPPAFIVNFIIKT